jgi:hypothetical protein
MICESFASVALTGAVALTALHAKVNGRLRWTGLDEIPF